MRTCSQALILVFLMYSPWLVKNYQSTQIYIFLRRVLIEILYFIVSFFISTWRKDTSGYPYCGYPPTTPGTQSPTLFEWCMGSFLHPAELWTMKSCKTGPKVYRPYPRILENLTIRRCNYKGCTFYSVILRPWELVRPGFEPTTSRTAVQYSGCSKAD